MNSSKKRSPRGGGLGLLLLPLLVFTLVGGALWLRDAVRLLRWRPTPALVVHSTVRSIPGSRGARTYAPMVDYLYSVAGVAHSSGQVLPGGESRSEAWATQIADRFPVGAHVTAYVDPSAPEQAFLVRRASAGTYAFVLAPALIALVVAGAQAGPLSDPVPAPDAVPDGDGAWVLAADEPLAVTASRLAASVTRRRRGVAALLVPYVLLVLACAAGEPGAGATLAALWAPTFGDGIFLLEALAVAGAVWALARQRRTAIATASRLRTVTITLDRPHLCVDEPFTATLALGTGGEASIDRLLLGLRRDTAFIGARSRSSDAVAWAPLIGPPQPSLPLAMLPVPADQRAPEAGTATSTVRGDGVTGSAAFRIPAPLPSSSDAADAKPLTTWAFLVRVAFRDAGDWEVRVPVRVHATRPH